MAKPFEADLEDYAEAAGIRTAYLITDGPAGEPIAERYGAAGRAVIRASLSEMGIPMKPTFLRISASGVVKAIWLGALETEPKRQRAWAMLTEGKAARLTNATTSDIAMAAGGKSAVVVGFSSDVLAAYPTAKYFDTKKLFERSVNELDKERGVIVDCKSAPSFAACRFLARELIQAGFSEVHTLGMPSGRLVCPGNLTLSGKRRGDGN